jgi:hypothetical protein
MSPEHTNKIEIIVKAEALLDKILAKAPVLRDGEKISVFSGRLGGIKRTGDYGSYNSTFHSLFLTREGLTEQRRVLEYTSDADGFPTSEDEGEYPVEPSYLLVQKYEPSEDDLTALEELLHQLQLRIC